MNIWRDAVGTLHRRAGAPARIISLVPSLTELICDLGLCQQLVGRTGASLAQAARARPRQRVLYLIWKDPWMTVARDTYISRTLALSGWDTVPVRAYARYPQVELKQSVLRHAELLLLPSEPYRFRERHLAELRALPAVGGKPVALIDGEMASWYGSRAIAGMDYLRQFRGKLAGLDTHENRLG